MAGFTSKEDVASLVALAFEQAGVPDPEKLVERLEQGLKGTSLQEYADTLSTRADQFLVKLEDTQTQSRPVTPDLEASEMSVDELLASLYPKL